MDHIGDGRFGINIVCGWNADEFEMFGIGQREHDDRYAFGEEWWDIVQRVWSETMRRSTSAENISTLAA